MISKVKIKRNEEEEELGQEEVCVCVRYNTIQQNRLSECDCLLHYCNVYKFMI